MNLITPVRLPEPLPLIRYDTPVFSAGSCFSVHIAERLSRTRHHVLANPCGITFNPASILVCIKRCISPDSLPGNELVFSTGRWVHHDFHGSLCFPDKSETLETIHQRLQAAGSFIKKTRVILLTVGTSFVYKLNGRIVNNCHKRDGGLFTREMLEIDDIAASLRSAISLIRQHSAARPSCILTLSPVRHSRDGFSANQESKARALLAIHHICREMDDVHYFPAYEIMLDELRDYRFYDDDMLHPSRTAIQYIYERFEKTFMDPAESPLRKKAEKIHRALQHRPFHEDSDAHRDFINKLSAQMAGLEKAHPAIDYSEARKKLGI